MEVSGAEEYEVEDVLRTKRERGKVSFREKSYCNFLSLKLLTIPGLLLHQVEEL